MKPVTDLREIRKKKNKQTAQEQLKELQAAIKKTQQVLNELQAREALCIRLIKEGKS